MARGLTIAAAWITFASALASVILLVISSKYMMKSDATDADKAKARQLGMAGFWVLVVALIFALMAAISSSCSMSMRKMINDVARRMGRAASLEPVLA